MINTIKDLKELIENRDDNQKVLLLINNDYFSIESEYSGGILWGVVASEADSSELKREVLVLNGKNINLEEIE